MVVGLIQPVSGRPHLQHRIIEERRNKFQQNFVLESLFFLPWDVASISEPKGFTRHSTKALLHSQHCLKEEPRTWLRKLFVGSVPTDKLIVVFMSFFIISCNVLGINELWFNKAEQPVVVRSYNIIWLLLYWFPNTDFLYKTCPSFFYHAKLCKCKRALLKDAKLVVGFIQLMLICTYNLALYNQGPAFKLIIVSIF